MLYLPFFMKCLRVLCFVAVAVSVAVAFVIAINRVTFAQCFACLILYRYFIWFTKYIQIYCISCDVNKTGIVSVFFTLQFQTIAALVRCLLACLIVFWFNYYDFEFIEFELLKVCNCALWRIFNVLYKPHPSLFGTLMFVCYLFIICCRTC